MKSWTIALLAAGALAAGCGGEKSGASGLAPAEKIGIQACDDYIAKMDACVAKTTDEKMKAAILSGYKDTREYWLKAAAKGGPEKDQLEPICKAAVAAMDPRCK